MGKYTVYSFDNPYLKDDEGENRYSAAVIMDEARERWRTGNWRARRESFDLSRRDLTDEKTGDSKPSSSRFRLDVRKDLMGDTISLKKLSELSYSPSYRPQGNLDEQLVTPMSTMQRYDVLAGDLENPPEDLSFLTDADNRLRRELEKSGSQRDGSLRKDTRRLDKSLSERRAALIEMLPDADTAEARRIVRESQRRKERMDIEIGRLPKDPDEEKQKKKKRRIYAVPVVHDEEIPDLRDLSVLRQARMPKQYGMDGERPELPEFQSETRHWSRITSENPSWSEVQQHTEHLSPSDLEDEPESRRARYVDDVEFDPDDPFRPMYGMEPRERLYSEEVGQFENEYNLKNGISPERVREIMDKEYRGRWIPPEYYADNRLVDAWFNDLNRGALEGEDFLDWAYRRRMEAANARRMAEEQRRRRAEDAMRRRRRGMPPPRPDHRDADRRRYEQAKAMGYRQGRQMSSEEHNSPRGDYRGMYPDLFDGDNSPPRGGARRGVRPDEPFRSEPRRPGPSRRDDRYDQPYDDRRRPSYYDD